MKWLPDMDLNHDKQIQSLLCYRYTIGQVSVSKGKEFIGGVKTGANRLRIETLFGNQIRNPKSEIRT